MVRPMGEGQQQHQNELDRRAADQREMRSQIIQHRIKYNYFVMGLATASMAFAFHQTRDAAWSSIMWLWIGAVCSWVISIILGLIYDHNGFFQIAKLWFSSEPEDSVNDQIKGAKLLDKWLFPLQHISLLLGMVSFLIWHVQKMLLAC